VFVVVVVAGVDAVVEQVGGAVGFTGVDQGAGQGVADDLAFDSDPAEAFGVGTQAAEQVDRGGGAPGDEVGQCLSDRCEDLRVVGAGSPAACLASAVRASWSPATAKARASWKVWKTSTMPPGAASRCRACSAATTSAGTAV
jgi:hypothetical protein